MQILFLQLGKPLAPLGATTFNLQGLEMHQGAVGLDGSVFCYTLVGIFEGWWR